MIVVPLSMPPMAPQSFRIIGSKTGDCRRDNLPAAFRDKPVYAYFTLKSFWVITVYGAKLRRRPFCGGPTHATRTTA